VSSKQSLDFTEQARLEVAVAKLDAADRALLEAKMTKLETELARIEKREAEIAKRLGGRPIKEAKKGRRYQIGVIVTGEIKTLITKRAKDSGRTISREVEIMIEHLVRQERAMGDLRIDLEDIERGANAVVDAALWRRGYTPQRHIFKDGRVFKVWAEPGFPGVQRSGFGRWKEGERKLWFPDWTEDAPSAERETK